MEVAFIDAHDQITLTMPGYFQAVDSPTAGFSILKDRESVNLRDLQIKSEKGLTKITLYLTEPVDVTRIYEVLHPNYHSRKAVARKILDAREFIYSGDDLGPTYSVEKTKFRVWAPTASHISIIIYNHGDSTIGSHVEMRPDVKGTWVAEVYGDLKNKYYTYQVHVHGVVREAVDPYVKAVNVNGTKGAIIDLKETNPVGWDELKRPEFQNFVDAIIYETHIRDLTIASNSGIFARGKFLALTEEDTRSPEGFATGLAHLKELGITHLHLLPIMESEFILDDEDHYNWGYGTNFFFAAEGQYVTDPNDPVKRVKELKQAIMSLHKNGIRVVMDVVYNHLGRRDPDLEHIVPGYYLRRNEKWNLYMGSGVNNDFASERPMARKLMIDSLKYWVQEYKIDGYRFDLMGLHDRETMLQASHELHELDPTILLYGEAWYMHTGLPFSELMVKNSQQGTSIGIFNDNVRDVIVSGGLTPVTERGFASGKRGIEPGVKKAVVGSIIDYEPEKVFNVEYHYKPEHETIQTLAPHETINYVTSHDNYALRDRLEVSNPEATEEERKKMAMLANGIILTCQGIPFLAGGVEVHKTKFGDENSYQSPDYINEIDWSYKKRYYKMFKFYQGLITLRKSHPAFRMTNREDIRQNLKFHDSPEGTVVFSLRNYANKDSWRTIVVVYNQNNNFIPITLPGKEWKIVVKGDQAGVIPIEEVWGDRVEVPPISIMVMYEE